MRAGIKKSVANLSPLLLILVGVALVAFTIGPYETWDTQLEFEAASNVVKMGIPYVEGFGNVIDQPPLGFYIEGLFFGIFGLSVNTGVVLVTFFGLAATFLVYFIGKELYDNSVGLVAAALFGLNPWLLILSRSFLIDTQCLFISLLTLFAGIFAIRKGTVGLALIAGLAFAAAFLTKFYAFFMLIPLIMLYLKSRPTGLKQVGKQLAAFAVPVLAGAILYYQVALGRSILAIFIHNDFDDVIPASTGVVPSPLFVGNFLIYYGLGWFLIAAIIFSLFFGLAFRQHFPKVVNADLNLFSHGSCGFGG